MSSMEKCDTSREAQEEYDRRMRTLTPEGRFFKTMALVCISRQMAMAGIRARFPHLDGEALKRQIILEMYPGS